MDRETRAFAEQHFRDLGGQLHGGGQAPRTVAFIEEPAAFSYADFVKGFLLPNRPCVFSSAFTQGWGSRRRWVTPAGKPDFEYLLHKYGEEERRGPGQGQAEPQPGTQAGPGRAAAAAARWARDAGQMWGHTGGTPDPRTGGGQGAVQNPPLDPLAEIEGAGSAQTPDKQRARMELRPQAGPAQRRRRGISVGLQRALRRAGREWCQVSWRILLQLVWRAASMQNPQPSLSCCLTSGDVVVPVANCGVQEYNSNPKEHMPLREYISYWREYVQGGCSSPRGCLYLKDWHLCR